MVEVSPVQVAKKSTVAVCPVTSTQFQVPLLYSLMAGELTPMVQMHFQASHLTPHLDLRYLGEF